MISDNNFDTGMLPMNDEEFDINKFLDGEDAQEISLSDEILSNNEVSDIVLGDDVSTANADNNDFFKFDDLDEFTEDGFIREEIPDSANADAFDEKIESFGNAEGDANINNEENLVDVTDDVLGDASQQISGNETVPQDEEFVVNNDSENEAVVDKDVSDAADIENEIQEEIQEEIQDKTHEDVIEESDGHKRSADVEVDNFEDIGYVKWYSGNSSDLVFEIDKSSLSQEIVGTDECSTIHVNIGLSSYGWRIQFDNDIVMSIDDVREYQLRNGCLPSTNGNIIHGDNQIKFTNINKITIYRSVRYFTYR